MSFGLAETDFAVMEVVLLDLLAIGLQTHVITYASS